MDETRTLANFVDSITYNDLPEDVISKTKELILDQLGCQLAGSTLPLSKVIFEYVNEYKGKQTESTIVNYRLKAAAQDAAFANANFGHAFMGDDTDSVCHGHFGSILIPSALAISEREKVSGKDFILAVVTGYEVASRIGAAARTANMRGFHPGPIFSPFGVAAAAGKIMGFNKDKLLDAISIAGSQCSGLMEYSKSGGSVNRLHSGIAAYGGIRAALMAQKGFTGPPTVLEGERGFLHAYAGEIFDDEISRGLGSKFRVLLIGLKPYCCCGTATSGLDALSKITRKHAITPNLIEEIVIYAPQSVYRMAGAITKPGDITSAQLSGNYCFALRLIKKGNSFREYTEENLHDTEILELASRIKYVLDNDLGKIPGCDNPSKVVVKMKNGATYEETISVAKGSVHNPMSRDEVNQKFTSYASEIMPEIKAKAIIEAVYGLDLMGDISSLTGLLSAN